MKEKWDLIIDDWNDIDLRSYLPNWKEWVHKEDSPLVRKQKNVIPFLAEVFMVNNIKLTFYRKLRKEKRKIIDGWINYKDFKEEDFSFFGKISVQGVDVGTFDKYVHKEQNSFLRTIAIDEDHRNRGYCNEAIGFLAAKAKKRGSEKFILQQIITEKEGVEYCHNPMIFSKIAQNIVNEGIAINFSSRVNVLNPNRLDFVIELRPSNYL